MYIKYFVIITSIYISGTTLTVYIFLTLISYKACKVLTCTILCELPKLELVIDFNELVRKIVEAKVKEKCNKKLFS